MASVFDGNFSRAVDDQDVGCELLRLQKARRKPNPRDIRN